MIVIRIEDLPYGLTYHPIQLTIGEGHVILQWDQALAQPPWIFALWG